jgi:hypothetical protein
MDRKILGIRVGTLLAVIVSLAVSVMVWLVVKFNLSVEAQTAFCGISTFIRG